MSWYNPKSWYDDAKDFVEDVAEVALAPIVLPTKAAIGAVQGAASMLMGNKQKGGSDSTPDTTTPEQKITDAKADSLKRRRKLYATSGGSLGEEVERVGDTFGNGRGSLFGN